LAKKPAKGGMPAKENKTIKKQKAKIGCFFESPDKS
jgi:hypothetical protein